MMEERIRQGKKSLPMLLSKDVWYIISSGNHYLQVSLSLRDFPPRSQELGKFGCELSYLGRL
jgi:hypothetical protein